MAFSIPLFILAFGSPIFIGVFYWHNFEKWTDEHFEHKWGAPLEGLDLTRRITLLHPIFFCLRRIILVIITVYFYHFVWMQLFVQTYMSLAIYTYLITFKPLLDSHEVNMEIFNEVCTLMLVCVLYTFTEYVPDPVE